MIHKIWCETCRNWVADFSFPQGEVEAGVWTRCFQCGEGLMLSVSELSVIPASKTEIARAIWGL